MKGTRNNPMPSASLCDIPFFKIAPLSVPSTCLPHPLMRFAVGSGTLAKARLFTRAVPPTTLQLHLSHMKLPPSLMPFAVEKACNPMSSATLTKNRFSQIAPLSIPVKFHVPVTNYQHLSMPVGESRVPSVTLTQSRIFKVATLTVVQFLT